MVEFRPLTPAPQSQLLQALGAQLSRQAGGRRGLGAAGSNIAGAILQAQGVRRGRAEKEKLTEATRAALAQIAAGEDRGAIAQSLVDVNPGLALRFGLQQPKQDPSIVENPEQFGFEPGSVIQQGPGGFSVLQSPSKPEDPPERKTAKDRFGVQRFVDTGAPVFDQGRVQEEAPEVELGVKDTAGLRKEFTAQSKDFVKIRDAFGKVREAADNPSAAGDLAMVFNFMKILDPGSVVRESEFATAQNAAGVPDRVRNTWNRVLSGERLGEEQRQDFVDTARRTFNSQVRFQEQLEGSFKGLAERQGAKPENVVVDFLGEFRSSGMASPTEVKASDHKEGTIATTPSGDVFELKNGQWVKIGG